MTFHSFKVQDAVKNMTIQIKLQHTES